MQTTHDTFVAFGSLGWQKTTGELLDKVRDWDMVTSVPVLDAGNTSEQAAGVNSLPPQKIIIIFSFSN